MFTYYLHGLIPGCKHFYWHEVLWLPTWRVHVFPTPRQYTELIETALVKEKIRKILGDLPMTTVSGLRPKRYNKWEKPHGVGGSKNSYHIEGKADDFIHKIHSADEVRAILRSHLEELNIRMENYPGSSWTHIDRGLPSPNRFFKP